MLEAQITEVKGKNKYRQQNLICFHLQGCSSVLKRPPTLPTSNETHCNDKRFGNLPPSFRCLAFFLGSITARRLALVTVDFPGIPVKAKKRKYLERSVKAIMHQSK